MDTTTTTKTTRRTETAVVVGVDGGGTKTIAVCLALSTSDASPSSSPVVLGRAKTGPSNQNSVGKEVAKKAVQTAILQALTNANCELSHVCGVCLCMSGVDRPCDVELTSAWVRELLGGQHTSCQIRVHNDAYGPLAAGTGGELYGVVLIAGTGMIAFGVKDDGQRTERTGGWGPLLSDRGSGYWIGASILEAVVRATDGLGPKTQLVEAVLEHLQLPNVPALIGWIYTDTSWDRIASLAVLAFSLFSKDEVATKILLDAGDHLAEYVEMVATRLGFTKETSFPIVLSGSIVCSEFSPVRDRMNDKLSALFPNATVILPKVEAEIGAALLIQHVCTQSATVP
mmetsp:Transcript_16023/g.48133  ORF Transcript_16023/g.48133 Transcript_16023/m.48133 type:complete len:342 (+) Transcript_16023:50-1075(+)